MQKIIFSFLFLISFLQGFSQTDSVLYLPVQTKLYFNWGNDSIAILLSQYGSNKNIAILHVHDDEITSINAAKKVLGKTGGLLIQVENNGKRLMKFKKSGKIFLFDPNRIFTVKGLKQNLHFLNKTVTSPAISSVKSFSAFILKQIPPDIALISLHNNANLKYSINSYKLYHDHVKDVLKIYINRKKDPDNFFLVTKTKIFTSLKKAGFNVVLQNNKKAIDDGSLSIYYGRKNKAYINVEAEHGKLDEQVRMLRSLINSLR